MIKIHSFSFTAKFAKAQRDVLGGNVLLIRKATNQEKPIYYGLCVLRALVVLTRFITIVIEIHPFSFTAKFAKAQRDVLGRFSPRGHGLDGVKAQSCVGNNCLSSSQSSRRRKGLIGSSRNSLMRTYTNNSPAM